MRFPASRWTRSEPESRIRGAQVAPRFFAEADKMPLGATFGGCYYPPHKGSNFSPVCRHYGAPISCSAPGSRAVDEDQL